MDLIGKIKAISWLLRLQQRNWKSTIRYELRFIVCGMLSYFTFSTFDTLKDLIKGRENEFLELFFVNPGTFTIAILVIFIGYFTLYLSIITAALFTSLLPATSD